MTESELNRIAIELFGVNAHVEPTCEIGEYAIYTNVWLIDMPSLDKLRAKFEVLNVAVSGYTLEIRVKI